MNKYRSFISCISLLLLFAGCGGEREIGSPGAVGQGDGATVDGDAPSDSGAVPDGTTDAGGQADDTGPDAGLAERVTLTLVEGCNPFATSKECVFPVPSAFFEKPDPKSPTGVRLNYPLDCLPNASGVTTYDLAATDLADGVSPVDPILLHVTIDVEPSQLVGQHELERSLAPDAPVALFNLKTGKRVLYMSEMDANRSDAFPRRYALIIRPLEPMEPGVRHAVVITTGLKKVNGASYTSPDAFAVLRDGVPTTNDGIESIRPGFERLFTFLASHGYARKDLMLAWDFQVASDDWLLGPVVSIRAQALDLVKGGVTYTVEGTQENPNENVSKIVWGSFTVPTFITADNEFEYDADHKPILQKEWQSFPYTMVIPKMAETAGGPLPLTVFGHGIFGEGRDYLMGDIGRNIIQPMAQAAGSVVIATDWIGLAHGDVEIIVHQVVPDTAKIGIVTDRLQQSLVNNLVMTELAFGDLQHDAQVAPAGHDLLDPSRVYYYGVSLGGIQGSSFVSISNRVQRGVLAVPGCAWSDMLPRSRVWAAIKDFFNAEYPDPLVRQLGIFFMQMRFDHSDPVNLTRMMFRAPLPDAPRGRAVVLQESIGDCQVPNMTTEMLARAIGLSALTPNVSPIFGLPTVTSPFTGSAIVQYELKDETVSYVPPQDNTMPTQDNGVHSDMCYRPNVLDQVKHFDLTGELVQYCAGPCDPE